MKATEYVAKAKSLQPEKRYFLDKGLTPDFVNDLIQSYQIKSRNGYYDHGNELVNLATNFNLKGYELTGIIFKGAIEQEGKFAVFANLELDKLAIDKTDQKVKLISFETNEPIFDCAINAEHFIAVLFEILQLITNRIKFGQFIDPCPEADRLAERSGLPASVDFYRLILGC